MRASPAFQITIERFGVWHAVVAALLLAAAGALGAWLMSIDDGVAPALRVGAAIAGAAALALCASLLRRRPTSLRWDTQAWHLGPAASRSDEPSRGRLVVAMDLGGWMLLKFEHDVAQGVPRRSWLPVQRRGLESQWHALRCAVYSARPAEGRDAGLRAAISPESQE